MKEIFLILFFLFPISINNYISQKIEIDSILPYRLITSTTNETYFFMEITYNNSSNLYFSLSDNSYGLKQVSYCISTSSPRYESTIYNCTYEPINSYFSNSSTNIINYYYKINIDSNYKFSRCVIVNYTGDDSSGSLEARSSFNPLAKTSLSTVALVLIIVGSAVFFVAIIIIIIYCVYKKRNIYKNIENGNYDNNVGDESPPQVDEIYTPFNSQRETNNINNASESDYN